MRTTRRAQDWIIPAAICAVVPGWVLLARQVHIWLGGAHYVPLGHGLNLWAASHLVRMGRISTVFDPHAYGLWFAARFGGDVHTWSYPPSALLLAMPVGLLPPSLGVVAFDLASFGVLLAGLRAGGFGWRMVTAILFCPAALSSVSGSQNGALIAGPIIAGLFLAERRPWPGGVLVGLATIKPQLGLLIPVYWLARGNWRAMAAAAMVCAGLVAVSAWAFTAASWVLFVRQVMPFMASELVALTGKAQGGPRAMIMSSLSLARQLGLGREAAAWLQGLTAAGAVAMVWVIGRRGGLADRDRLIWVLLLGMLASPYIWCYDMIPASLAVAMLGREGLRRGFFAGELFALGVLWVMPGLAFYAALLGWPMAAPVFVVAVLVYAWRHIGDGKANATF